MTEKPEKAIKPFFYPFIEPDVELTAIRTTIDVNWVIFFPIRRNDIQYALECTTDLLKYVTGNKYIQLKENVKDTIFTLYTFQDQAMKVIIIDQELSGLFKSIHDIQLRELFLTLMLQQDYLYYNFDRIKGVSVTSYIGSESVQTHKIQSAPQIYKQLQQEFKQISISEYAMDGVMYIFINQTIEVIESNEVIKQLFREGLRRRYVSCAGACIDKLIYYEIESQNVIISNLVITFDTLILKKEELTLQHPIQLIFLDMYIRIQKGRENIAIYIQKIPLNQYFRILNESDKQFNILNTEVQEGFYLRILQDLSQNEQN